MRGFLIFISVVCGFYILSPDPIPFMVDDIVILIICIFCIIGAFNSSSSTSSSSYDNDDDNEDDSYERSTTIYNYNSPGRTISLDCSHCGASLEIDPDNLIARCPYCNHKILLDTTHLGQFIAEHEKTKREQERTRREKEKTERENLRLQYELEMQRMEIEAEEREKRREHRKEIVSIIVAILILIAMGIILRFLEFH